MAEREYPPLPSELLYTDRPIWSAICEWEASARGPAAGLAANRIDEAIKDALRAYVDADRAASLSSPGAAQTREVPQGWKLVPIEPTEDMMFAAEVSKPRGYRDLYAAMLSAAPASQPVDGVQGGENVNAVALVEKSASELWEKIKILGLSNERLAIQAITAALKTAPSQSATGQGGER